MSDAKDKYRAPRRAGDFVTAALKELGLPSRPLSEKISRVWKVVADPSWEGRARPVRYEGGVLEVGVDSAPLREELVQFHSERLMTLIGPALGDLPLVGLRFVMDEGRTP